jgi:hypothetical protein
MMMLLVTLFVSTASSETWWRKVNTDVQESGWDTSIHVTLGATGTALLYHYLPKDINPVLRHSIANFDSNYYCYHKRVY